MFENVYFLFPPTLLSAFPRALKFPIHFATRSEDNLRTDNLKGVNFLSIDMKIACSHIIYSTPLCRQSENGKFIFAKRVLYFNNKTRTEKS